jgi:hypothetical protein
MMNLKHKIAAGLLVVLGYMMPWRLSIMAAETFLVTPGHTRLSGGVDRYFEAIDLEWKLTTLGWTVVYEPEPMLMGQPALGITYSSEHRIVVDKALSWNDRYVVLAHEAGHTLQPGWVDRNEAEVFAEGVAMLVTQTGPREHARYLAGVRGDAILMVISESAAMTHAAALLGDR